MNLKKSHISCRFLKLKIDSCMICSNSLGSALIMRANSSVDARCTSEYWHMIPSNCLSGALVPNLWWTWWTIHWGIWWSFRETGLSSSWIRVDALLLISCTWVFFCLFAPYPFISAYLFKTCPLHNSIFHGIHLWYFFIMEKSKFT